eukprot:2876156-Pleurochrysis_carterae.AAC.1
MFSAAVAAGVELRRPLFLGCVRLVVALRIGSFAIWFAVRSPLECVAFGQESSAQLASVDSAVFASFHFREHI